MKILSFTHPHVLPNLYSFLSAAVHKRICFNYFVHTIKVNGVQNIIGRH